MYSPKIKEELIPKLYQLKRITKQPMTAMVNEAIVQYLERKKNDTYEGNKKDCRKHS